MENIDKDYGDLLKDVALLDKLKKEEEQNFNLIIRKIHRRKNSRIFWRIALSGAAVVLVSLVLGNLLKNEGNYIMIDVDEYALVETPVLITETGEEIALKNNNSYTLEYVDPTADANVVADAEETATDARKVERRVAKEANHQTGNATAVNRNTVIIPNGYTYNIKFDDGTEAHINSGSYIEYPKSFSNKQKRVVSLTGEGYFKVAKSDKPFIVKANGIDVTVYGTEFNVNTNKESRVEVVLVSGAVGVKDEDAGDEILLSPNEMVVFNVKSGQSHKQVVDTDDYLGWMNGDFTCSNSSLFDLLDEICAFYGIAIEKDELLSDQMITISLSRKLGYKQMMEIMEAAFGLVFTQEDKNEFRCSKHEAITIE